MDRFKASLQDKLKIYGPKLGSFANETYNKIKDLPRHVQPFKDQLSMQFRTSDEYIIKISEKLYWMTFPDHNKIEGLGKFLNSNFQNNYYIWNVSEHEYATEWFQNQVANHVHPGYPCPSLLEIFTICKNILNWLNSDSDNIAIINCQITKGRSILILSILLALQSNMNPAEVLLTVCQLTQVKDFQALFPSQHLYLTYAENLLNDLKPNQTPIRLVSIILSQIPELQYGKKFAPYLQIFREGKIIFNSLSPDIPQYDKNDNSVLFQIGGLELNDDILIRCKHFESNVTRVSLFRIMFNTSFIFGNVLRFSTLELDQTSNFIVPKDFFIDLIFERGIQKSSQKLWQNEGQDSQIINPTKQSNDFTQYMIKQVKDCQNIVKENKNLQIDAKMFDESSYQVQQQNNSQYQQTKVDDSIKSSLSFSINEDSQCLIKKDSPSQVQGIEKSQQNNQQINDKHYQFEKMQQPKVTQSESNLLEEILSPDDQDDFNNEGLYSQSNVSQGDKQKLMNEILSNDQNLESKTNDDDEELDDYISSLTKEYH